MIPWNVILTDAGTVSCILYQLYTKLRTKSTATHQSKKIVQIINNEMPQIHVQPVNIHPLWNNMTHSQTTNSSMDCTACTICKYLQIRVHIHQKFIYLQIRNAFSALTPLAWRQKGHPACKNWVVGCWHGNLSGARCRLAYGPADATATHCLLFQ